MVIALIFRIIKYLKALFQSRCELPTTKIVDFTANYYNSSCQCRRETSGLPCNPCSENRHLACNFTCRDLHTK